VVWASVSYRISLRGFLVWRHGVLDVLPIVTGLWEKHSSPRFEPSDQINC
jgi:hypothetical protein